MKSNLTPIPCEKQNKILKSNPDKNDINLIK
jgi:hypothetical protein